MRHADNFCCEIIRIFADFLRIFRISFEFFLNFYDCGIKMAIKRQKVTPHLVRLPPGIPTVARGSKSLRSTDLKSLRT